MSDENAAAQAARPKTVPLNSATQAVPFPAGVYRFSVRTASPVIEGTAATPFPALLIAAAPLTPPGAVEFVGSTATTAAWLCNIGDVVVTKIGGKGATLILSSLRTPSDTQAFDIKVEQINAPVAPPQLPAVTREPSLKLRVVLHLNGQGEAPFAESVWAGRPGTGAWIEAMSIVPIEGLTASDIECKGLAANGFETAWLSDGAVCGTKGAGVPLIGFALRLKPAAAAEYDCEYNAYFRSGVNVGPLRNGVPCRSRTAGDPLEAVLVRVVKRGKAAISEAQAISVANPLGKPAIKKGPNFGKFREEDTALAVPARKAAKTATKAKASKAAISRVPAKTAKSTIKSAAKVPAKKAGKATKPSSKRK